MADKWNLNTKVKIEKAIMQYAPEGINLSPKLVEDTLDEVGFSGYERDDVKDALKKLQSEGSLFLKGEKLIKASITSPIDKMWCVCPEMEIRGGTATSKGGETSGGWKHRDEARKQGKDVPFGGCICSVGDKEELMVIVKELFMSPSS